MFMECQYFNDLKFTRDDKTGYYLNSTIRKRLHRYVWEYYNGDIPKGCEIHHKDLNKENNDISNLVLMTKEKHAMYHANNNVASRYEEMVNNLNENARPKAIEWHKSNEGREWHKIQGKERYDKREYKKYTCEMCNKEFERNSINPSKFCSGKCKSAWRRKQGLDNEERVCKICNSTFITNKYSKALTCSNSCANRLKSQ